MMAEIDGQARSTRLAPKQECDRGSARRVARQGFHNGAAQSRGTILIEQLQQLRCLSAGRLALRERQVQERFALWDRLLQQTCGSGIESLALKFEQRLLVYRIEHQLTTIVATPMASYFDCAIQ